MKQKNEIISYGNIWGWDFTQSHTIIVFSLIDFDYYSEDQKHIDSLFYLIERVLIESNLKPIAMKKRGEIVVIYQLLGEEMETNESVIKEFIQRVKIQAEIMDRNNRMATGIGRESSNPEELYKSYQEAKVAYEVGLLLNIHTPFFNGLGLERILYKHDLQDVKEYYDHTLGKLEKHDQVHGGELMHTLEFYAANQYDITKTADALFLHRNTLRYRFKKVEEILDKKLDDMNVRLNITAAFKIKQLRKI
nr:helix-turn-helix domain-containing protein [Cytobacillus eiseniae]